ncbi:hypothetical protein ACLMAL_15285 [Nocardia sp. CWNU-33]|uniref:hypothetical protein n=1 Tax=Nocardia sp. CWNU-33 TaxID=3392117 RepID=UPI00398E741E
MVRVVLLRRVLLVWLRTGSARLPILLFTKGIAHSSTSVSNPAVSVAIGLPVPAMSAMGRGWFFV